MPAATPSIQKANQMLSGSDSGAQADAHQAVSSATSIVDAIASLQFFDDMEDAIAIEARAVLAAFPESIDQALLATLKSALGRQIPVTFSWEEEDVIGLRIKETTEGAGEITIVLTTPHGTTFVS